jgi:hypothetical protein
MSSTRIESGTRIRLKALTGPESWTGIGSMTLQDLSQGQG